MGKSERKWDSNWVDSRSVRPSVPAVVGEMTNGRPQSGFKLARFEETSLVSGVSNTTTPSGNGFSVARFQKASLSATSTVTSATAAGTSSLVAGIGKIDSFKINRFRGVEFRSGPAQPKAIQFQPWHQLTGVGPLGQLNNDGCRRSNRSRFVSQQTPNDSVPGVKDLNFDSYVPTTGGLEKVKRIMAGYANQSEFYW